MPERDPLSAEAWWGRIDTCRKIRTELFATWRDNVSYRRLRPFRSTPSEDTVNIPADWSRTKNKQAQLFFQLPELVLRPRRPEWAGATSVFGAALNFELAEKIHAEYMMNECLGDVINAAGIMIAMIGYDATFEDVPMSAKVTNAGMTSPNMGMPPNPNGPPLHTLGGATPGVLTQASEQFPAGSPDVPQVQGEVMPEGTGDPNEEMIPRAVYECYTAERISPAHFLWPIEFVGSNWQKASFLGHEGYMLVAEAIRRGWVPEGTEGVQITDTEWLLIKDTTDTKPSDSYVKYVQLFTRPYNYDPSEKDPQKIRRIVLIETGDKDTARKKVVDEDLAWQRKNEQGRWVGLTDYPIKVGTITHISDLAIPPSDSEAGRSQVKEQIKSRNQMLRQRDHSLPLRWFDVNQVDPVIGDRLRKGKWQDMIPMNGPGTNAIGEVARAQYPPENWNFDKVIKGDLDEAWSMGPAQQGIPTPGETTATEVKEMAGSNNTRLDYERQWVLRFFLDVAKGVGSLMQLFSDDEQFAYVVGDDGVAALKAWNRDQIQGEYIFEARPDSQLRLDLGTRRAEGLNLYKLLRKDPLIDPTALVRRLLEDHGLDPSKMIVKPQPPKLEKPKVSASLKGEDLVSPMAVALINKGDAPVTAQDIAAAKALIQAAQLIPEPPSQVPQSPGQLQQVTGETPEHPGPMDVVPDLARRYEAGGDHGAPGSRDSGMPTVPR